MKADLKGVRVERSAAIRGRVPGRGESKCKGPEERAHGRRQQEGHCSQSSE